VPGGAELPAFAGKGQKVFMPAVFTTDPGKSHMEITSVQIFVNHSHDICPPEAQAGFIYIVPCPFNDF